MAWVEEHKAPNRIEAVAGRDTPWPGRTRPLCPYPQYARYRSGDAERAESFVCERASAESTECRIRKFPRGHGESRGK